MELRQINTFIRVAQFKSFSRAAESLGYSQSAVTVQIRQLEDELHTRLFDRMGKRIILTGPGAQFLERAYEVLNEVNKARLSVSDMGELTGRLHIGTIASLCFAKLPAVLRLYWERHPKVVIRITTGEPEDLIEQMERGELDLIYILDEPQYNNNWRKLMERRENVVFVASPSLGKTLQSVPGLRLEHLLDKPFFLTERDANYRRVLDRFLASRDIILTPFLECSDTSFIIRMLESDQGISLLPWYAVEQSVRQGRLSLVNVTDFRAALYRQICSHKEKWRTREMNEFVHLVEELDR
ncbi:MAG: LysR family transcriptional regulator [Agathobaculum sp.]|uniref:LysR family transcriptional regulator n=1 Tax=Agathobaculum sp. TaxID=2048138 RepID=UPI0025C5AF3B|nr:LysR family transcriptional regulator [Agathobaculum sp.]MCI7126415.1 LysR family transcriptional regulator [Agathobaculum sp.]MDY3711506.1 LysR family transcriptional regulator [Agathobaculum sp.]